MKSLLVTIAVLMVAVTAHAATITVNSLADSGGQGTCVLRDAITAANAMVGVNGCTAGDGNDTINFSAPGQITLASTLPTITGTLTIQGLTGTPGTTIDGGSQVQIMNVASSAVVNLNRLTIAHGWADPTLNGGAIYNQGRLTVKHDTFTTNHAQIPCVQTYPHPCQAFSVGGGAIYNQGGRVMVISSEFDENTAVYGGAILNRFGNLNVKNSSFTSNTNGAIQLTGGAAIIANSTFASNRRAAASNAQGTMTIRGSTFSNNTTDGDGAALFNARQTSVMNSTFVGNQATGVVQYGGAIANGGVLTITASTISGNTAGDGGGIDNYGALMMKSTIFAGNTGGNCYLEGQGQGFTDGGYNIADDATCFLSATGSLPNTDPMLNPAGLANNGGPTQTIAVLSGSPTIDTIPVADCTDGAGKPITVDQRAFPRPGHGDTACGSGAYEFQNP